MFLREKAHNEGMETNPILYVILNKELNMSAGKASAQAVHAAMMLENNYSGLFSSSYKRTVVVLEAENENQIRNLYLYLENAGIFCDYYIDEGVNEVSAYSITSMAVEPIDSGDKEKREIFSQFKLFSGDNHDKEIERATSSRNEALIYLNDVAREFQYYDGMEPVDKTPRVIRKAIDWLRKHQ